MALTTRETLEILRRHDYKITPQRQAVIEVMLRSKKHLTPGDVHKKLRGKQQIGLVTIYRILDVLTKLGITCEVHPGNNQRSYLAKRPSGHHHHLICSSCGEVVDFTGCDLRELESRLTRETKFAINSHRLEFTGLCQACQNFIKVPAD